MWIVPKKTARSWPSEFVAFKILLSSLKRIFVCSLDCAVCKCMVWSWAEFSQTEKCGSTIQRPNGNFDVCIAFACFGIKNKWAAVIFILPNENGNVRELINNNKMKSSFHHFWCCFLHLVLSYDVWIPLIFLSNNCIEFKTARIQNRIQKWW